MRSEEEKMRKTGSGRGLQDVHAGQGDAGKMEWEHDYSYNTDYSNLEFRNGDEGKGRVDGQGEKGRHA